MLSAMTGPRISALTTAEKELAKAFARGATVDLTEDGDVLDDAASWPADRTVRASVIAGLVLNPPATGAPGIALAGVRVVGGLDLRHTEVAVPLFFRSCVFDAEVSLAESRTRSVRFDGCLLTSVELERSEVRGELMLAGCLLDFLGLYGARVSEIEISGCTITAPPDGPDPPRFARPRVAVNGDLLVVDTAVYCHDVTIDGQFRLPGARIGGYLELSGADIRYEDAGHPRDAALYAKGLRVDTGVTARRGNSGSRPNHPFTVVGGIDLTGATIKGGVVMTGAVLADAETGVAIRANRLAVEGGLGMARVVTSEAVHLASAQIDGRLTLSGARLGSLDASGARIDGALFCDAGFTARSADLRRARTVTLVDDGGAAWPEDLRLDGFTYDELSPLTPAADRLRWIQHGPFQPQPYEHLAARYRSVGRDGDSRRVLMARQRRGRAQARKTARAWGLLQDAAVGYGYRPWLAGIWLLALLAAGSAFFATHRPAAASGNPPHFNAVAYTLDLLIPVVNLGQSNAWNPSGFGQFLAYALMISGWTLATALLAGVTRVVARP